jgi:hypothetical protein
VWRRNNLFAIAAEHTLRSADASNAIKLRLTPDRKDDLVLAILILLSKHRLNKRRLINVSDILVVTALSALLPDSTSFELCLRSAITLVRTPDVSGLSYWP